MTAIFYNLPRNILACFKGANLFWQILAIALTALFVLTGLDWFYLEFTRSAALQSILWPAVIIGARAPIFAPAALYLFGFLRRDRKARIGAAALVQAILVALLLCAGYKALTGRAHPPWGFIDQVPDTSRVFHFGFLQGGIYFGWPSSHTTVAFAMAVTLAGVYRGNRTVLYLAVLYALYIGIGVSATIHWFSDFVAGAILGSVIGNVVGKRFEDRGESDRSRSTLPRV